MEPVSNQDGVVNMTRAIEAVLPWLNHPRRTIKLVEYLVLGAAGLLLLQLFLGSLRRRRHSSFVSTVLLPASSKFMEALVIYILGTMQSSPIKNSSYPVWAAFLIMASAGTTSVQQYGFCDSFKKKCMECLVEILRYNYYGIMFILLIDPNTNTWRTTFQLKRQPKNSRATSKCVIALFFFCLTTKFIEFNSLVLFGYKRKYSLFIPWKIRRAQVGERKEETANTRASDSDPRSMKGYEYAVCHRPCGGGLVTIDQIWDSYGNSALLKDLCLSCALFQWLVGKYYFGVVNYKTSPLKDHDFVFKKLLPSEADFKRAFRIIEVELGFCYDFFFTKYWYKFQMMNLPVPFIQSLILGKIVLILIVGVFTIRKSLVLETPSPIIQVHISEADYIITLLLLGIALIVELVQAAFYLASNWGQVSLATMHVKKHWYEHAFNSEEVIAFLRRVMICGQLLMRNRIKQHSVIFRLKQLEPVEVSDAVKRAVARSLISKYGNNLATNGETSLWQNKMFEEYSWAIKELPQLDVMLIWHIATEYCDISSPTPSNWTTRCRCSKHRGFAANFFTYCANLVPNYRRNRITRRDNERGVAVHLSRYCSYLIGSVPELLPYHKADIAELAQKVMEERTELFGISYRVSKIYSKMKDLKGTGEEDDPQRIFEKGIKLGKQLESTGDEDRWEVLQDFWAETIIHAAKSHYTTKQHMQHLENGGQFLTHIWALLAHAGILSFNMDKGQTGHANPGSSPSAYV